MKNGHRITITADSEYECERQLIIKLYDIQDQLQTDERYSPTLQEVIQDYYQHHLRQLKSGECTYYYLKSFIRDNPTIANKPIHQVTPQDITAHRNVLMKRISNSTVVNRLTQLSGVFNYAIKERYWIDENPVSKVTKPTKSPPRNRRITQAEINALIKVSKYCSNTPPKTVRQWIVWTVLFALQTCMRQGEILGMTPKHMHKDHVHLPKTKNGTSRNVPLNKQAKALLRQLWLNTADADKTFIPIKQKTFNSTTWHNLLKDAGITNLHFHDTRHEAISRFVHQYQMPVEVLAKITGHKDLRVLLNTYYNPTVDELVEMVSGY
ncbi:tyrosine-type recombinase/integrase [Moraxella sp. ZJ142]|uniref:tyrosine-type recombinase/integrase n=1 Tax=Moraxella marmotae TaxID=3344520 RepID=UPI0035D42089